MLFPRHRQTLTKSFEEARESKLVRPSGKDVVIYLGRGKGVQVSATIIGLHLGYTSTATLEGYM